MARAGRICVAGLLVLSALALAACPRARQPRLLAIELPPDVNALAEDVIAFRFEAEGGKTVRQQIPLERLEKDPSKLGKVALLDYAPGSAKAVAFERRQGAVEADLEGGHTYLIAELPDGRLADIYGVLCAFDLNRAFLDRVDPDLWRRLCPVILCASDLVAPDELFTDLPAGERAAMEGAFELDGRRVGGWGEGGGGDICDRCTGFQRGGVIVDERCFDRQPSPDPTPPPGCETMLLNATFDADVLAAAPSSSPAGAPVDDSLDVRGPDGNVVVVDSTLHASKAVRISRGSGQPTGLTGVAGAGPPHDAGKILVGFEGFHTTIGVNTPELTIAVRSSSGLRALLLTADNGEHTLQSGSGTETLAVGYAINVVDEVLITLDMDADTFVVAINGTEVAAGKPFLDPGFADVLAIEFDYPGAILEAFPADFVVDDLQICR